MVVEGEKMKDFRCPFCLEKFNSRSFMLNIHIPKCQIREDYFNKVLEPWQLNEIKKRVEGEMYKIEVIETETFHGRAHEKEEIEKGRKDF
jgi:hypothetical protein